MAADRAPLVRVSVNANFVGDQPGHTADQAHQRGYGACRTQPASIRFPKLKTLAGYAGSADTDIASPGKINMTRKQAQALDVVRFACNAARKTGLPDAEIFAAIGMPIYPRGVAARVKPNK
jgi:hypothetical protein